MSKFKAIIKFKVEKTHPDIEYIKNPEEVLSFEDVYSFNQSYSEEDVSSYIKNDLSIVAGGGYDDKHINILDFVIEKIE